MSQPPTPPPGAPRSGSVVSISSASPASSSTYLSPQAEADRKQAILMNMVYALYWSGRINLWHGDRVSLLQRLPPEYQNLPVRAFPQGNIGDFRNLLIAGQQSVPSQTTSTKMRTGRGRTRRLSASQAERQVMVSTVHLRATGFRFVKMLGYGGMGVTALFETTDEFGLTHKVVAKVSLDPDRSLEAEKENHAILGRCLHIIGTLKASSFFVKNPTDRSRKNRIDVGNDILLLEFMKNGDLETVLEKLGTHRVKLCNRLLWMIFECLFKGCIAMAWAGNQIIPESTVRWDEKVGKLEEDDPDSDYSWLHLDLDPLNVLVGDLDFNHSTVSAAEELVSTAASAAPEPASTAVSATEELSSLVAPAAPEPASTAASAAPAPASTVSSAATEPRHCLFPIIKVSDLGCGRFVDTTHWREVVDARYLGKWEYKAPEQTTLEWEYLDDELWEKLDTLPILAAGQYGRWTNLWHVGLIMWCIITGLQPLYPPKLKRYISNNNGTRTVEYSYGCALLDPKFSDVDPRLRKLIISCMKHDPLERPLFDEIEDMIETALDDPNKDKWVREQDDGEMLRLVHWLFNEPKDAPPPHMSGQRSVAVPRSPRASSSSSSSSSPSPPAAASSRHPLSAGAAASAPAVLSGPQAAPAPPVSSPAVSFSSAPAAGSSAFAPPAFAALAGASANAGQPSSSSGTRVASSAGGNNGGGDGDDDDQDGHDDAGDGGAPFGGGAIWTAGPGAREDDEESDIYDASDYMPGNNRSVSVALGSAAVRSINLFDFSMSTGFLGNFLGEGTKSHQLPGIDDPTEDPSPPQSGTRSTGPRLPGATPPSILKKLAAPPSSPHDPVTAPEPMPLTSSSMGLIFPAPPTQPRPPPPPRISPPQQRSSRHPSSRSSSLKPASSSSSSSAKKSASSGSVKKPASNKSRSAGGRGVEVNDAFLEMLRQAAAMRPFSLGADNNNNSGGGDDGGIAGDDMGRKSDKANAGASAEEPAGNNSGSAASASAVGQPASSSNGRSTTGSSVEKLARNNSDPEVRRVLAPFLPPPPRVPRRFQGPPRGSSRFTFSGWLDAVAGGMDGDDWRQQQPQHQRPEPETPRRSLGSSGRVRKRYAPASSPSSMDRLHRQHAATSRLRRQPGLRDLRGAAAGHSSSTRLRRQRGIRDLRAAAGNNGSPGLRRHPAVRDLRGAAGLVPPPPPRSPTPAQGSQAQQQQHHQQQQPRRRRDAIRNAGNRLARLFGLGRGQDAGGGDGGEGGLGFFGRRGRRDRGGRDGDRMDVD